MGQTRLDRAADTVELDVRPRENSAYTVTDVDGREMVTDGAYREVVEPERLAFGETSV